MKKALIYFSIIIFSVTLFSCSSDDNETVPPAENIVPEKFKIDIPLSISDPNSGGKVSQDPDSVFDMSFIYEGLPLFIHIGENSADIVENIIIAIGQYNLAQAQTLDFTSNEDGRLKELQVKNSPSVNGTVYQYGLQVKDKVDDVIAMQVFWNNSPVEGFAVMNVFQMDRNNNDSSTMDTFYKVRYTENPGSADAEMEVWIADFPANSSDTFALDGMRMLVQKTGDVITVLGNSNHPNFVFSDGGSGIVGRNYAFRARGDEANDVGVAEIALPPSIETSFSGVYRNYNILEVCKNEYGDSVESALFNYLAPGYFSDANGFLGDGNYNADPQLYPPAFVDLTGLRPFVPSDIRDLQIEFENF